MFAETSARALAERHPVLVELVRSFGIEPALRLKLQRVLSPEVLVGMDTPGAHANCRTLREKFTAHSSPAGRDGAGKAEPSGWVQA